MGDGTIELVDLKSNSTTVLVKLADIKDVSIPTPWRGRITLTSGTGQRHHPPDFGLEDLFRHETSTLENRPSQAMATLEFRELLDPRYRVEEDMVNDYTLTTAYHSLCSMVTDRTVDRLRRQQRHLCYSIRRDRFRISHSHHVQRQYLAFQRCSRLGVRGRSLLVGLCALVVSRLDENCVPSLGRDFGRGVHVPDLQPHPRLERRYPVP